MNLPPLVPVIRLLVAAVAITAAITDIRSRRIPNWLVLPAIPVGLLLNWFLYPPDGLIRSAIAFAVAFGSYFVLYLLHAMSAGDVKLMGALGALLGAWQYWLVIFMISSILGGILALALMVSKHRFRKTLMNTGYIVWELAHFRPPYRRSDELDVHSSRSFRLPHAVPVALGCLAFLGSLALVR